MFNETPEQPFSKLTVHFKNDVLAPIANPLQCGTAVTTATFTPFSNPSTPVSRASNAQRDRLRLAAAVLADPGHPEPDGERRRQDLLHVQPVP